MRSERERASDGCVNTINLLQLGVFKTFPGFFFYKVRPVICVKFEILFPGATFGTKSLSGVNVSHSAGISINRYRRKRPKVDASIFDLALSHTRRSDASEKREENSVSTFGRFCLWTSFESSPVSVKSCYKMVSKRIEI